jgi:hypothetical protein
MTIPRSVDNNARRHVVLTAIDFNHQTGRVACEVDNKMIDWQFTAEMEAVAFQRAQEAPELSFGIGRVRSKLACALVRHCSPHPGALRAPTLPVKGRVRK